MAKASKARKAIPKVKTPRKINPNSIKNLKKFEKGNNANPLGGKAHDPVARALRVATKETYNEVIEAAVNGTEGDLKKLADGKDVPAVKRIIAGAVYDAIRTKDLYTLERVMERLIGKVSADVTSGGKPISGASAVFLIPSNGKTKAENEK